MLLLLPLVEVLRLHGFARLGLPGTWDGRGGGACGGVQCRNFSARGGAVVPSPSFGEVRKRRELALAPVRFAPLREPKSQVGDDSIDSIRFDSFDD